MNLVESGLRIDQYADAMLTAAARDDLARYRYDAFVGHLGWELPCAPGRDQDQFDTADAVHVVASDDAGQILGYARLLPTTGPYVLSSLYPELLSGQRPPADPRLWELSRYTAIDTRPGATGSHHDEVAVGKHVLLAAIRAAAQRGASSIVFCTSLAIERLAMRWGVDIRRLGTSLRSGGILLVAALIDFTPRTFTALAAAADEATTSRVPPERCEDLAAIHG
jgi:N-acyl-L-homoserine lactone synthetase